MRAAGYLVLIAIGMALGYLTAWLIAQGAKLIAEFLQA